jgi:glycosyltransferase involved in cell wall biosynthesis
MSSRRVVQLLSGFADGDATSSEARALHTLFLRLGHASEIYAADDHIAPAMAGRCRPLSSFCGRDDDVLLHHYGIASPAVEAFVTAPGRKVLVHHNITPAPFFRGFDDALAERLDRARTDLKAVASACKSVWAVSDYNAHELRELGVGDVRVFPLIFPAAEFDAAPDPRILARFEAPMTNLLFVGRIAPNKCIEELILAFAWYKRRINPLSRLLVIGSKRSCPRYYAMLRMLADELDLENVYLEGFASEAGLTAYYQVAGAFVCASRHEGYCLPLVADMYQEVPVIARDAGGMPEAMGGAGVLFDDLDAGELAELIRRVTGDPALRGEVLASQQRRIQQVLHRPVEAELKALLNEVLS